MSEFTITCSDFEEGEEIPKKFGYKFENNQPDISFNNIPDNKVVIIGCTKAKARVSVKDIIEIA